MGERRRRWAELVAALSALALVAALALGTVHPTPTRAQDDEQAEAEGPPGDLPRQLVVEDEAFLFDRVVPIDPESLTEIGSEGEATLFVPETEPPFSRVFASSPDVPDGQSARYVPVILDDPDASCPAEGTGFGPLALDDATYAPVGLDPDLTVDTLQEIAQADLGGGQTAPIYAESSEPPFPELFVGTDDGLQRFLLVDDDGVPAVLRGDVPLGDQTFSFAEDVTDTVDQGALAKVGCAGLFPVSALDDSEPPFDELYIPVGDRIHRFAGEEAPEEATEEVTEEATEEPDEATAPPEETEPTDDGEDEEEIVPSDGTEPAGEATDESEDATDEAEPTAEEDEEDTDATDEAEEATDEAEPAGAVIDPGLPDGLQRSVVVEGTTFVFDRLLALDPASFQEIGADGDLTLYVAEDSPPFTRVFAAGPNVPDGLLARYRLVILTDSGASCPAEGATIGPLQLAEGVVYLPVGPEPDLTPEALQQITEVDIGGQLSPVYADGQELPFPELFVGTADGLGRFLLQDDQGLPEVLTGEIPAGEQTFVFADDATGAVDPAGLTKVGCLGLFAAATIDDTEPPFEELFVTAGERTLRFAPTEAPPEDATEEATPPAEETEPVEATPPGEQATPPEATPPPEETAEAEDIATPEGEDDETPPVALTIPEGAPRELVVEDARFGLDRAVPLSEDDLVRVEREGDVLIYAKTDAAPFDAVYGNVSSRAETPLVRYLPQNLDDPSRPCPAEATAIGNMALGETLYAFAGYEPDLTVDTLVEVLDADGSPVYSETADEPFNELFVEDETGLQRFVVLSADRRPAVAAETVVFAGQEFAFVGDATEGLDPATLTKLGCAGPFPIFAATETATQPFGVVYLLVGGAYLEFDSGEGPPPAATPTETPVPADTPVPTDTPVPPTETSVPTDTPVPPTDTAVATDTPVPADTPAPTDTPPVDAAESPTEEPPPAPTETSVPEAPTETPVPPAPVDETPPALLPQTIQVQGASFEFEQSVQVDVATLVEIDVIDVEGLTLTVYAEGDVAASEAERIFVATEDGQVGAYVSTAPPATTVPTLVPVTATPPPEVPAQIEVENTTYIFNSVEVDVDITTLVEVEVVVIQNVEYTVYARQEIGAGVAPECFLVQGDVIVGSYVPAARAQPAPPPELPPTVEVQNTTYVFNEVEVDLDVTILVEVEVVVILNVEYTIYVEQDVTGTPPKLYAVAPGGQVVGQYVQLTIIQPAEATPTPPPFQPPAVVATLPPNAPSPAAATAPVSADCPGTGGALDANGLPERLPKQIQYRGIAYSFEGAVDAGEAGRLTRLGCAGAFAVFSTDQAPREEVLYLRDEGDPRLYRYVAARTFTVQVEVTGQPRVVQTGEASYELIDTYERSVYSSVTAILFVEVADDPEPDFVYALRVDADVIGRYEPESENLQDPSPEIAEAAQRSYINTDLVLNGRRYVLTDILTPQGTTTNGFVTLYAVPNQETPELYLGVDPRNPGLLVYRQSGAQGG